MAITLITISYAIGLFLSSFLTITPGILLAFSVVLFLLVFWGMIEKRQVAFFLLLLVTLLGMFRYQLLWQQPSFLENLAGKEVVATGIVLEQPVPEGDKLSFRFQVQTVRVGENTLAGLELVLVQTDKGFPILTYGDRVRVRGKIVLPPVPANFQDFNYRTYLKLQGVRVLLASRELEVISRKEGNWLVSQALQLKEQMLEVIYQTLPPREGTVLRGFLFGDREALGPELLEPIEKSGVVHLLAVSGLHVGFVAGLGYALGILFHWPPRFTAVVSGLVAGFYMLLVGFRASVLRASVMLWVGILGLLLYRRANSFIALSVAALVLLLVRPGLLFTPGFQLSFTATWGILYLFPFLVRHLRFLPRWLAYPLTVSAAAQLATWPILAYHFGGVATWAVLVNLVAVPLAGAIVSLGFLSCILGLFFIPLAGVLGAANEILIKGFLELTDLATALPLAYVYLPRPCPAFLVTYYGFLYFLPRLHLLEEKFSAVPEGEEVRQPSRGIALCLVIILAVLWAVPLLGPSHLEVTFLSVGAGDAVVVTVPGGRTFLIDTGPGGHNAGFDAGARVVVPYLRRQGIRRLELIFLTHPHRDHWGGLTAIVEAVPVGGIVLPPGFMPSEFGLTEELKFPLYRARAGDRLALSREVELAVLHPPLDLLEGTTDDSNNNSLVLYLKKGRVGFLLAGDLDREGEEFILRQGLVPKATVLKVGHHGACSATSWAFLERVQPSLAVISTGPNAFGHPHPETLERLNRAGVKVYRTDRDGAVRMRTDGKRVWVETARREHTREE